MRNHWQRSYFDDRQGTPWNAPLSGLLPWMADWKCHETFTAAAFSLRATCPTLLLKALMDISSALPSLPFLIPHWLSGVIFAQFTKLTDREKGSTFLTPDQKSWVAIQESVFRLKLQDSINVAEMGAFRRRIYQVCMGREVMGSNRSGFISLWAMLHTLLKALKTSQQYIHTIPPPDGDPSLLRLWGFHYHHCQLSDTQCLVSGSCTNPVLILY